MKINKPIHIIGNRRREEQLRVARQAHNLKVGSVQIYSATKLNTQAAPNQVPAFCCRKDQQFPTTYPPAAPVAHAPHVTDY